MTAPASTSSGRTAELADLMERLTARVHAGERIDPDELLRAHPEHADELRRLLPALALLADFSRSTSERPGNGDGPPPGELGDFRLLREVGRGGMGIVYEAEQVSLRRRVALKILPLAGAMDARQLQRFRHEAQAAAMLHHPNIVPVYAVGCERGVHYFAMQFIDGVTLAQVIRDAHPPAVVLAELDDATGDYQPGATGGGPPTPPAAGLTTAGSRGREFYRSVARLIAEAAEALEYAHSLGVVHRDVKPGNLLVDQSGKLWVADFGLARFDAGASLTVSGDLLGTLRYMSPEQALAKHGLVDHRTDVYALGATLYELLTGRPAVDGDDRQEVLRKIAFEEPAAPRQLERSIPVDLETVVLKALAKEPAERYASAKELADDLARYLVDQPVKAKRPTVRQRLGRWARRHPWTMTALATVALIATAAWVTWDRQRLQAEATASQVAEQAEELWHKRRLPEAEAVAHRAADLLPRFGGSAELRRRVEEMVADFTLLRRLDDARLERLNNRPDATSIDPQRSRSAFAAAFREEYGIDVLGGDEAVTLTELGRRAVRTELVAALDDWAAGTKDPAEARRLWKLADALDQDPQGVAARWRRLKDPGNLKELRRLAVEAERNPPPPALLVRHGLRLIESSDRETGLRLLYLAQRLHPDHAWVNAVLVAKLREQGPSHAAEALRYATAEAALRPNSPVAVGKVAECLNALGRHQEALDYCRMAAALDPSAALVRDELGYTLYKLGRREEAAQECRRALALSPNDRLIWKHLGLCLDELGRSPEAVEALRRANALRADTETCTELCDILGRLNRFPEAEAAGREAVRLAPRNAEAHFRLGLALLTLGRTAEAADSFRRSNELKPFPTAAYNLGFSLGKLRRWPEAESAYRQAIQLDPKYALAHYELGKLLLMRGDPRGAAAALRTAIRLRPDDADAHFELGRALFKKGDFGSSAAADRTAIRLRPEFAQAYCNLGQVLRQQCRFAEALQALRRGHELGSRSPGWKYPSAQWVRECEWLVELQRRLPAVLGSLR